MYLVWCMVLPLHWQHCVFIPEFFNANVCVRWISRIPYVQRHTIMLFGECTLTYPLSPIVLYTMYLEVLHKFLRFELSWASLCLYLAVHLLDASIHKWKLIFVLLFYLSNFGCDIVPKVCFCEWYPSSLNYGFHSPMNSLYYPISTWSVCNTVISSNIPFF